MAQVRNQPISLVELQQRVAAGENLDFRQTDITFVGDAIEVRLNAWHEDLNPVLGGRLHALSLDVPPMMQDSVRIDAGGLLQRRESWFIPSYDANFALIVVTGRHRRETLERMIAVLDTALQIDGNAELHTNLQPVLGLLTLMRVAPPATEFRTDTSLLWMACVAVLMTRKREMLSLLPDFPRQSELHNPARFARLLRATLEAGMAHPSRLLTYYLKRLTDSELRPLSCLEVLFQLAEELKVSLFEEERQQREALREVSDTLWTALSASPQRYTALISAMAGKLAYNADHEALCAHLREADPNLAPEEAAMLLDSILAWLSTDMPALTMLLQTIESTQLHTFLEVRDDLALTRPLFLENETQVARLHHLLSTSLRPTVLCDGELLSPMEATIFLQPEPSAPLLRRLVWRSTSGKPWRYWRP